MIEIGAKLTVEKTVTPELTAQMAGSGMLPVFGTPFMTAMMENAAAGVLQQYLEEGKGSVGTHLNVSRRFRKRQDDRLCRKGVGREGPHRRRHPHPGDHHQ